MVFAVFFAVAGCALPDLLHDAKIVEGPHTGFWRDIVLTNGSFVAYPDGI